jgi:hypothetical protein
MSEPLNSIVLVLAGALLGAIASGCWCGCLPRWRWRRSWRRLAGRQGKDFSEAGHTARFLAHSAELRMGRRARELRRASR